jgi:TPR repeat protein
VRRLGLLVALLATVLSCHRWVAITSVGLSNDADEACGLGDVEACGVLAEALGRWGRHSRAVALARDACDGGSAMGCAALARALAEGEGVEKDQAAAIPLYRRACNEGVSFACVNGAVQLLNLPDGQHDYPAAAELSLKACDAGEHLGCANFGHQLYDLEERDFSYAMTFFLSTCDAGLAAGCRRAARGYLEGKLPIVDRDAGLRLALHACEAGDARGCKAGWEVLWDAGQPEPALRLLRRSCVRGWACTELTELVLERAQSDVDIWDARDVGEAACRQSREGCVALARALAREPQPDRVRADALLQKMCDAGTASGCALLESLADAGAPSPR